MFRVCITLKEIPIQKYLYSLPRDMVWVEVAIQIFLQKYYSHTTVMCFRFKLYLSSLKNSHAHCSLITKEVGLSLQRFEKCSHNNYCVFFNIQHILLIQEWKFAQSAQEWPSTSQMLHLEPRGVKGAKVRTRL